MAEVQLKDVRKSYGSLEVMRDISLTIENGSFCVILGPSGCGKSTLLRMIAGLEDITGGSLTIGGADVTHAEPFKRGIAMVFQSYALYPHLTVAENIGFGLSLARMPKAEIRRRVEETANVLQLGALLDRKPKALSGGQRQRVAIGRAIIRNPKVFLLDEPLSNLDAALRTHMRMELSDLQSKLGATMVYVTHDQIEAMTLADRIVVLNSGNIEQIGAPMELYSKPATPFVAGFIGLPKMNLYEGETAAEKGCDTYGIRPEDVMISQDTSEWTGAIHHIERLGADTILHVSAEMLGNMLVRAPGDRAFRIGERLNLSPREGKEHRYKGGRRIDDAR